MKENNLNKITEMIKMNYYNKIQRILGVDIRARYCNEESENYDPFKNPLIHKQIHGREIVPLDVAKLWGK